MTDLRTSEEWHTAVMAEYPGFYVMDPGGWDRAHYQYSWHEELITREEFERRLVESTCAWPRKMLHDIMERYKND